MKQINSKLIALMIVAIVLIGNTIYAQVKKADKYSEIKIKTSAQCDMCKETIEKALAFEKGVKSSDLNVDTKVCTVKYDATKTTTDKIKIAISKVGYDADDVKADPKAYNKLSPCCKKDGKHK
ncbi:MAG: heavy-metal-associated domain-containing protein [Bacteroidota bacterium]